LAAWHKGRWLHRAANHPVTRSTGWAILHTSKLARRILHFGIGILIVTAAILAYGAWRLSQGPLDSQWLVDRVTTAAMEDMAPLRVSFGSVELTWDGFRQGVDYPLDLHMSGLTVAGGGGIKLLTADTARVRFSLTDLILGRAVPRAIEVEHARISLTRDASGQLRTGGTADDEVTDLRQLLPSGGTGHGGIPPQLRRLHFSETEVALRDAESGLVVRTPGMEIDIGRQPNGHFAGRLQGPILIGNQQTSVTTRVDFVPGGSSDTYLHVTPFRPNVLGTVSELTFLRGIDVPVSLSANLGLGPGFDLGHFQISALIGEGRIQLGKGAVPVVSGEIAMDGNASKATISKAHLVFAQAADGLPETADLSGSVAQVSDRLNASLSVAADHIDVADLPKLWPDGIGGNARPWIVAHILGGMASHGAASFTLEADKDLHDVAVTRATGDLTVSDASFTWLDNMPPVEQAEAHLHLVDPDTLDIAMTTARQRVGPKFADLTVSDGRMRILGLSVKDQITHIHGQVEGPVPSALSLLSEPRLRLLSVHPLGLKLVAGQANAKLDLDFPLENKLRVDDIAIQSVAHLTQVRVLDVVAGQALEDGTADLDIDKDGLSMKGLGTIAGVRLTLAGTMDFRDGAPDQVVQKITASGQADAAQLDAAGLHVTDLVTGPIALNVSLTDRRNGETSIALGGDLTGAALNFAPLAWRKPAGAAANATATLLLSHGRLNKIDRIVLRGDGVALTGTADFKDGHARSLSLDDLRLGRTQGHGVIRFGPDGGLGIALQGSRIDLEPKLTETNSGSQNPATTPPWTLEARFEKALLAHDETASDLLVRASGAGEKIKTIDAVGSNEGNASFSIKIDPRGSKRTLAVRAADAGRFLRGMDLIRTMSSGRLTVEGTFDSESGFSPLTAKASMDDAVVRNSPILGKLLQAITLYGLVDALRGPGMLFPRIVVPFRYDGRDLTINDALATNPSLGLTASGRIGLAGPNTSLTGTIVPAYFFNSIPGQLPLIGKLFSPEKGGGLFAARFSVEGAIADPNITVNPVSALTPGFLRGIFGIFDNKETKP
jgi:hypothetical protein